MSEEKKKEQNKPRTISRIALKVGLASFLCMLLMTPGFVWAAIVPRYGMSKVIDSIDYFFFGLTFFAGIFFMPLVAVGLVLSIITLFIERNLYVRLLPLVYVVVCIGLYFLYYFISESF